MIKGCQRKIIYLKDTKSAVFEEAYFVLRPDAPQSAHMSESDMVREAGRIVERVAGGTAAGKCACALPPERAARRPFCWFSGGAVTAAVLLAAVYFIFLA